MADPNQIIDQDINIDTPSNRILNVNIYPLAAAGSGVKGFLVFLQDVTDPRSKSQEKRRVERLLSIAHMAAGLSHEIRNPLNSLSIRLQLLKRTIQKDECFRQSPAHDSLQEDLSVIEEEIQRLNQVVEQVLAASVSVPKNLTEIDPAMFLEDFAKRIGPECDDAGVMLEVNLNDLKDAKILGDPNSLRQVFLNLAQNAIQAMPNGGRLGLEVEIRDAQVCFIFSDTGRGISEDDRQRVFEPYYTTRAKGTGLGLVIVERTIQNHHGSIELDSTQGKGSEFRILLPIYHGLAPRIEMKNESYEP